MLVAAILVLITSEFFRVFLTLQLWIALFMCLFPCMTQLGNKIKKKIWTGISENNVQADNMLIKRSLIKRNANGKEAPCLALNLQRWTRLLACSIGWGPQIHPVGESVIGSSWRAFWQCASILKCADSLPSNSSFKNLYRAAI